MDEQTLALTIVSFTDLVLAFGMHAWPETHTPFGDLSVPARAELVGMPTHSILYEKGIKFKPFWQ